MIKLYYIILDYIDFFFFFKWNRNYIDIDWFLEKHIIVY